MHAESGRSRSNRTRLSRTEPQKLGNSAPFGRGAAETLTTTSPSHVLPCQIWSFCIKGWTSKQKGTPKSGSAGAPSLAFGFGWPLEIRSVPTCYRVEFSRFRSDDTSVINEIRLKIGPNSRLSGSLEVIGTDTNRSATYDFLLTFHSKHGHLVSFSR